MKKKTEWLKEKSKSESSSDDSISQLWYNLCTNDCLVAKEKLLELFQFDQTLINSSCYDKDTVHEFAEFQVIFFFATILNHLLQYSYPETNMTNYNGLFLNNAVNFTSAMQDWIQEAKNAYSVHSLLEKVFDMFSVLTVKYLEYKKPRKNKEEQDYIITTWKTT